MKKIKLEKLNYNLLKKNVNKILYSPYLYLLLGLVIGLLVTAQFKNESNRPLNPTLFYNQLEETKLEYKNKKDFLNQELNNLQNEIREKEKSLEDKNYVSSALLDDLKKQEMLLGTNNVEGEGIIITISDGEMQIKDEVSKSLTHAADLRDIVNLLWYAGAGAISVNNERIIYNTSIDCIVSTIMVNNNNYVPPFTIRAIGNKQNLYNTINNSRKLEDIKKRADKKQIKFEFNRENKINISRYNGIITE